MGLDMYLLKRKKAVDEVAYWRKCNQIREWFVNYYGEDFVDNGDSPPILKEDLQSLVELCKKVLAEPELAENFLPTSIGFFFGSQEYDWYYFEDLKYTVEMLEKVIAETDWDTEEVFYSEWY